MIPTPLKNEQIELAFEYVQHTNKHIFLTGKAGTGKTTFLHRVKKECVKRMAVVAPTGVAAINAKGMTIHSLFQLPFGTFVPGSVYADNQRKVSRKRIDLIRSLDLLIIDEVSMVRADLLDAIDDVLRRYRNDKMPFGGVQLLMIGDLHQLPPVVKPEDWDTLRKHYDTPYFFGSLALRESEMVTIQLRHIYRQSDAIFIDLLNRVRNNQIDQTVLDLLNSRYQPNFEPKTEDGYITLTSHNATASNINSTRLAALLTTMHRFEARITGNFPPHNYPNEEKLEFKVGAQVVFIKNDLSPEKRYYNGKIGKIEEIGNDTIIVKCPEDLETISVTAVDWQNINYELNETTKEVTEDIVGTFTQFPLKLAWAITIHKSQGLTFDRAIIDAKSAFAHGQVYVALSRCRSFEGIVLMSRIGSESVRTDSVVKNYSENAAKNEPTPADLEISKAAFQQDLIRLLFNFREFENLARRLNTFLMENDRSFVKSPMESYTQFIQVLNDNILTIAKKFLPPLERYFVRERLPEENSELLERLTKAGQYFTEKLQHEVLPALRSVLVVSDNQSVKARVKTDLLAFEKMIFIKNAAFEVAKHGFEVSAFLKIQANADLDFEAHQRKMAAKAKITDAPSGTPNPELYAELLQWREEVALERDCSDFEVLPQRTLAELVETLPTSLANLKRVKGIGDIKIKMYGDVLVEIIERYCVEKGIKADTIKIPFSKNPTKPKTEDTKKLTLDAFQAGKSIAEIAKERDLKPSTIETHLSHFIAEGVIPLEKVMTVAKINAIKKAIDESEDDNSLTALKIKLGDAFSFSEIRMVLKSL
jgi:hypothetical protein